MDGPRESETRKFLRKRAPFYLAGITILAVFVVPGMLEKDLGDVMPDSLSAEDADILDMVLGYDGGDGSGMDIGDAVSDRIESTFSDGNIYDHRSVAVRVEVMSTSVDSHRVLLDFQARGGELLFDWSLDADGAVRGNNDLARDTVDSVNFYD